MRARADALPLSGLRIIVTRPDLQAGTLRLLLEAQGAQAARLPLYAVEASGDDAATRATLDAHRDDAGWIFTSANAVRYAAEIDIADARWPPLYAIGAATAAALDAAGHPGAAVPEEPASSETLLALEGLQQIDGQRFLLITGENGRELIAPTLQARGATVDTLTLYRRRPVEHEPERIESELAIADAIVITSGQTLDRLWALTPEPMRPLLRALQLIVPSARIREQALALGFADPLLPEAVSDEAIVRCLCQWQAQRKPDSDMTTPDPIAIGTKMVREPGAAGDAADASRSATRDSPPPPPAVAAPSRSSGIVAWLLVVLLAGALGYGGWLLWDLRQNQGALLQAQDHALRRLMRMTSELENQGSQTATRQSDLARVMQRASSDLAALQGRIDNSEQLMGRITEELQGGRTRFALASVEQLLLLASDRLLLQQDVRSALLALQIADQRLGTMNDPRLFRVREAIARERAALQALPRPDLTSASLTLSSLIDRAATLPLRARIEPRVFGGGLRGGNSAAQDTATIDTAWYQRIGDAIRTALANLFVVRRDDKAGNLRLLPPEDEAVIVHVLILKLESARVALLRGETASLRESLGSAADWLRRFFRDGDPGVEASLAEIERLQSLELSAPAPDLSESLTLLRQAIESAPP